MPCSTKPRVDFISTLPEFYAILHSKKRFEDLCSKLTLIDVFGHISCVHNCFQLYYQYFLEKKTFQTTTKFCHFGIPKYFLRGNTENQVFKDSNCRLIQFIIHIYFGITKEVEFIRFFPAGDIHPRWLRILISGLNKDIEPKLTGNTHRVT